MNIFMHFKNKLIRGIQKLLNSNGLLACSFLLFIVTTFAGSVSSAADLCIPKANGVPGTLLWQKPPNWFDLAPGYPIYDQSIDAPSWRGAVSNTYPNAGSGTTEHVKFRALHRDDSGTEYLYLSWYVKVAPNVSEIGNNLVWIGFHNPLLGPPEINSVALKVELATTTDQTAASAEPPDLAYITAIKTKSGATWDNATVPAWLTDDARIWITATGNTSWAIHMRIKTTGTNDLTQGVNIGNVGEDFKMWYEVRVKHLPPQPPDPPSFTPYKWPRLIADMDVATDNPPDISNWEVVNLTNATPESPDSSCPTEGVSLLAEDIGTTNADPHAINLFSENTIFAKPRNNTAGAGSINLKARFRTANWGVQATWEDNSNPANTLWEDLGPVAGHPAAGVDITNGTQGVINFTHTITSLCDRCEYKIFNDVPANKLTCDASTSPPTSCAANSFGTKRNHQCLLVELIGTGVNFINDSAYRNMNFVNASEYSEIAEVNTIGLGPNDRGTMARDVYLYVETLNMPQDVMPGDDIKLPGFDQPRLTTGRLSKGEVVSSAKLAPPALENMDFESLSETMPTYRVHAYYDSGLRNTAGDSEQMILRPMTSFGYFVMHEGSLVGWEHGLEGANLTQLSPNYYKVAVGDDGIETINTTIKALERAYAINFKVGVNNPHNNFSGVVDSDISLSLGLEYIYSPTWTFEAIFGAHSFDDAGLGTDLDIDQIAINARYYIRPNIVRPYINAGIGQYSLVPGSSEFGANAGIGFLYDLMGHWSIDAAYNYYDIDSVNPHPQFSTLQIGLRYRF